MKKYTHFSVRTPLAVIGRQVRKMGIWETIAGEVKIQQKKAGHKPVDKLLDAWINILSGGHGLVEVNTRVRSEKGLQKAFGRKSCAEQSTISRSLNKCTPENVAQLRRALQRILRLHGRAYRHDYQKDYQWLDVDITGLLAGRLGEGVTKGYFAGKRNRRGRQLGRVLASLYQEIVEERLYPGTVQLERSLQELVLAAEAVLELDEERRKHTILRIDGGGGRDADINWMLLRGYYFLTKVKNWQRADLLLARVQQWIIDPKDPKRQIGWVAPGFEYQGPTRQIGVRETRPDGKVYDYVLVFNLSDEMIYTLNQRPIPSQLSPAELLALLLNLYDLRSGGVETSNRNSKSGLGLNKRNKRLFAAQEMLVLLAQLAYNVLIWIRQALARPYPNLMQYGLQRLVRDLFSIPGKICVDEQGRLISIVLSQQHILSRTFLQAIPPSWLSDDLRIILRKI